MYDKLKLFFPIMLVIFLKTFFIRKETKEMTFLKTFFIRKETKEMTDLN